MLPREVTPEHYTILQPIGKGGMGQVFLTQDTILDRKVALKFLPESMQKDPDARRRFLREAKSAAALAAAAADSHRKFLEIKQKSSGDPLVADTHRRLGSKVLSNQGF